jgi:thiamine-monophosphate kinase
MSPEFALIHKHFTRPVTNATLGVGDDSALVRITQGCELAISTDSLVAGTHFYPDTDPERLGHKALAVNLSDLAAMGATPRFVTLAITLPAVDEAWLAAFTRGFFALADQHKVELIGGDTTKGPLSMTLTVLGEVPAGRALRRDGAQVGDDIWVSGELGGAALGLAQVQGLAQRDNEGSQSALERLYQPQPRVGLGVCLRGVANSAIDVSDGLLADLMHICERSTLAAEINWQDVPRAQALAAFSEDRQLAFALSGGEDYELCFTASPSQRAVLSALAVGCGIALARIGQTQAGAPGVQVFDQHGQAIKLPAAGFDHFSATG